MHSSFVHGFEKTSELDDSQKRMIRNIGAGALALGAGVFVGKKLYRGLRPATGKTLAVTQITSKDPRVYKNRALEVLKRPATRTGKLVRSLIEGADKVVDVDYSKIVKARQYGRLGELAPKPKRVKQDILLRKGEPAEKYLLRGKRQTYGEGAGLAGKIGDRKDLESRYINKVAPEFHAPTETLKPHMLSDKGIKSFHKKWDKGQGYYIKPIGGQASGVGGGAFISNTHIKDYMRGRPVDSEKVKMIEHIKKNPHQYVVQKKHKMVTDKLTGSTIEYRIHTKGGKIIPGATLTRSMALPTKKDRIAAETAMQKFLDKMPRKHKSGTTMAADLAKTDKGYKIIELNAGGVSGFTIPQLALREGPIAGPAGFLEATLNTQKIYKSMTGRSSRLEAGTKALGAGAATASAAGGIGYSINKRIDKKEK